MAQHFSDEELEKYALKIIEESDCETIGDLIAYMPISRTAFYNRQLDKVVLIKDAIVKKQCSKKKEMRQRWQKSNNATLEVCAYKLIATSDELERLQNTKASKIDVESNEKLTIKREVISKKE